MRDTVRNRPTPQGRPGRATPAFSGKYLSLTSFRRDGTGVATPVWFVEADGRLLVETDASSYKVRRIRRDPQVTIAPCTARDLGHPGAHAVVTWRMGFLLQPGLRDGCRA